MGLIMYFEADNEASPDIMRYVIFKKVWLLGFII